MKKGIMGLEKETLQSTLLVLIILAITVWTVVGAVIYWFDDVGQGNLIFVEHGVQSSTWCWMFLVILEAAFIVLVTWIPYKHDGFIDFALSLKVMAGIISGILIFLGIPFIVGVKGFIVILINSLNISTIITIISTIITILKGPLTVVVIVLGYFFINIFLAWLFNTPRRKK